MKHRIDAVSKRHDGSEIESHALWNFGGNRTPAWTPQVENLHQWRSHYPIERQRRSAFPPNLFEWLCAWAREANGCDLKESPSRSLLCTHAVHLSEPRDPVGAVCPGDATNVLFVPVNRRAARLGPDWDLKPGDLASVSNFREWSDVRGDLVGLVRKPLNPIMVWLKSR